MSRSVDHTRRAFLKRLARGAAFVPPAMVTLEVASALGQGKGTQVSQSGGKGQGVAAGQSGGLTPTSAPLQAPSQVQVEGQADAQAPWNPGEGAQPPPWSRPPPTQTGR